MNNLLLISVGVLIGVAIASKSKSIGRGYTESQLGSDSCGSTNVNVKWVT